MSPVHTVHNGAPVFKHRSHPSCPLEYLAHVRYSVYTVKRLCSMMSFVSAKPWILDLSSVILYVLENILHLFFFFYLLGGSETYAFLSYLFSACCMPGIILGVRNSVAHTTEVPVLMDLAFQPVFRKNPTVLLEEEEGSPSAWSEVKRHPWGCSRMDAAWQLV